jgi:hypothetical protein
MNPDDAETRAEIEELRRELASILRRVDEVGERLNNLTRRLYGYPTRSADGRKAAADSLDEADG